MNWYCDVAPGHPFHGPYHDEEYGFPLTDDAALFERLCLEIFQAGRSCRSREEWVKLFKQTFLFMGGEVVNEFLMSIGVLPGAHRPDCPIQRHLDARERMAE